MSRARGPNHKKHVQGGRSRGLGVKSRAQDQARALAAENASLDRSLLALGLAVKPVKTDGNCLFRVLADQVTGNPGRHMEFRQAVVQYMLDNSSQFKPFFAGNLRKHCRRMSCSGVWGDHLELVAAGRLLGADVVVFQGHAPPLHLHRRSASALPEGSHLPTSGESLFSTGPSPLSKPYPSWCYRFGALLVFTYHGKNHYNSVVLAAGGAAGAPRRSLETARSHQVEEHGRSNDGAVHDADSIPGGPVVESRGMKGPRELLTWVQNSPVTNMNTGVPFEKGGWLCQQPGVGCPCRSLCGRVGFTVLQAVLMAVLAAYCATLVFLINRPTSCRRFAGDVSLIHNLTLDDCAPHWLRAIDPRLGRPMAEVDYAVDCRFMWPNLRLVVLDEFFVIHFVAWSFLSAIVRDPLLCFLTGVLHEVYEWSLTDVLPNYRECWWDTFADVFLTNMTGILLGTYLSRAFYGPRAFSSASFTNRALCAVDRLYRTAKLWVLPAKCHTSRSSVQSNSARQRLLARRLPSAPKHDNHGPCSNRALSVLGTAFRFFIGIAWHAYELLKAHRTSLIWLVMLVLLEGLSFHARFFLKAALWLPTSHPVNAAASMVSKAYQMSFYVRGEVVPLLLLAALEFYASWALGGWGRWVSDEQGQLTLQFSPYTGIPSALLPSAAPSGAMRTTLAAGLAVGLMVAVWYSRWQQRGARRRVK